MTRIAVTGVSGFVGRRVASLLVEEGHQVRGLARSALDTTGWPGTVELVRGDVRSLDTVRTLLDGCDGVVHLAGGFSSAADSAETITVGTRHVVTAARDAGSKRLVHLSCLGADAAADVPFYVAKWQAETVVRASGLAYTILRPSLVLGRGDGVLRPLSDLIRALPIVPIPGRGQHRQQPIDVEDLARCVLLTLTGEELIEEMVSVGGPMFVTLRQLVDLIAGQLDVCKPKLLVPPALLPVIARLLPAPARPLFAEPRLAQWRQGVVASPGIVPRMFGFEPRSIVRRLAEYLA